MEEFGHFLGNRLNYSDRLAWGFNFHVEDVNDSKNLAFQEILEPFGLIQHVDSQHINQGLLYILSPKKKMHFTY